MGLNDDADRCVEIPSPRHFGHVEVARLAGGSSAVVPPSIDVSQMLRSGGKCNFS
jgi:hypothetical protein